VLYHLTLLEEQGNGGKLVVAISGDSETGKSGISHSLALLLKAQSIRIKILHTDNSYRVHPLDRWKHRISNSNNYELVTDFSKIQTLVIDGNANNLKMHAWGKCHPQDCDWGEVNAYPYAPNVSSPIEPQAQAVSAVYTTNFSQTLVIVKPAGPNMIRAEVFTRFTDNSNRSNYTEVYPFRRQLRLTPIRPFPGLLPMPGAAVQEDCVSFNPVTTTVRKIDGSWKIVDGSHWLFDFGDKESEARTAYAIIKKYGFTRSCFVGRPDPSFNYLRK